jgi:uncharacterized Zn finger protein (UPF0148 family)
MKKCKKCKVPLKEEEGRTFHSELLCEDCYIDAVMPKMPKSHYDNDAEFMQRLKDSYPSRKQQFH